MEKIFKNISQLVGHKSNHLLTRSSFINRSRKITLTLLISLLLTSTNTIPSQASLSTTAIEKILINSAELTYTSLQSSPFLATLSEYDENGEILNQTFYATDILGNSAIYGDPNQTIIALDNDLYYSSSLEQFSSEEYDIATDLGIDTEAPYIHADLNNLPNDTTKESLLQDTIDQASLLVILESEYASYVKKNKKSYLKYSKKSNTETITFYDSKTKEKEIFTIIDGYLVGDIIKDSRSKPLESLTFSFDNPLITAPEEPYFDAVTLLKDPRYIALNPYDRPQPGVLTPPASPETTPAGPGDAPDKILPPTGAPL